MSTIAKIFVVLNLVLAVAFMIFTLTLYAHRADWKDKFEKKVVELKTEQAARAEDVRRLEGDITVLKGSLEEALSAKKLAESGNAELIDRWKTELLAKQQIQVRYDTMVGQLEDQQAAYKRQAEDLKTALETIQTQQKFVEQMKRNYAEIERQKVLAETTVNRLKTELHAVQDQRRHEAEELQQLRYVLNKLRDANVPITDIVGGKAEGPAKPIRGRVVAVRAPQGFVALSVGLHDGVQKGYEFAVSRTEGGPGTTKFIATVRVKTVEEDHCGCVILEDKSQGMPKEGDDALCGGFGGAPYGTYGTYEPVETLGTVPKTMP